MELVELKSKEILTDSHLVARKFGYKHKNLVRIIKNVQAYFEDIKGDLKSPLNQPNVVVEVRIYRGTEYTAYLMNREFFSLLVMRMKGKKAFEWQIKFNNAFFEMEHRILTADTNATDTQWLGQRQQGRLVRRKETDTIKEFVEYATGQGSKSANFYYKHITNSTYKALGLMAQSRPKLRDTMNLYEVSELLLAERIARNSLKKYMDMGRNYKDIYESVKNDLMSFGSGLRLE